MNSWSEVFVVLGAVVGVTGLITVCCLWPLTVIALALVAITVFALAALMKWGVMS